MKEKEEKKIEDGKEAGSAKERLLDAATDIFGMYGYEAATTRMIAREAGVNIAAIPYYFGGKEGLYHALIDHIVAMVQARIADVQEELAEQDLTGEGGCEKACVLFERLLEGVIQFMVGSPEALRLSRIILREQLYPSAAYEQIFTGFMKPILDSLTDLILIIVPDQTRRQAKLRAMAIMGQVVVFRVARETVVRALDMEGYSQDEMEEVKTTILEHTRAVLKGLREGQRETDEGQL